MFIYIWKCNIKEYDFKYKALQILKLIIIINEHLSLILFNIFVLHQIPFIYKINILLAFNHFIKADFLIKP